MKTAIIIVAIVLLLVMFIARQMAKMGRAMQSAEPMTSITKDGFLGFRLGDSYSFVWKRAISLGLMTQKEIDEEKRDMELTKMFGFGSYSIHAAKNKFEEIKEIVFCFDDAARLNHIMIYINDKEGQTRRNYMKELRNKYSRLIGNPNNIDSETLYHWIFNRSVVMMYYDENGITLHIQKP